METLVVNTKLVITTGSSDCGFSHQTSYSTQNIVLIKQPRKNSPIIETETECISLIREELQGRVCRPHHSSLETMNKKTI